MPSILYSQRSAAALFLLGSCLFVFCGCKDAFKVEDPQLKPIRTMLEQKLPTGTNQGMVEQFLSARGYETEPGDKPGTMVAVIHHVDPRWLKPVTARVTFYFDANDKLNTFELVRIANPPVPEPSVTQQQ
jgi:hypothetical protein